MNNIQNQPLLFSPESVKTIEKIRQAVYVCDTEHEGHRVAVFYGATEHPDSGSRYFALYYTMDSGRLMITDGSFIERQGIIGVRAENGDIIFSRFRHDYRTSDDGTVMVDGGRAYMRTNSPNTVGLQVINGVLGIETLV
jgi:hypothetical protein